jgi:alkylation response protein AidB-like acyl-CoA dehydrogenase
MLEFTQREKDFRAEIRDWLSANVPGAPRPTEGAAMRDFDATWQRRQYDAGYAGIAWPQEHGGRGLSLIEQLIWHEEYVRAKGPYVGSMFFGLNQAGPTLIARGDEAQKRKHLQPILRGEATWCQGFSEPNAGSDLASLTTAGVVEGDHLVVNGSKIWTSFAPVADYQMLLVRTSRSGAKHAGLSWVICDMHAPGVNVVPIRTMAGEYHFAQVFYDNVEIPLANVVGGLNNGWSVALTTLSIERGAAFIADQIELSQVFAELHALAVTLPSPYGGGTMLDDPACGERLGQLRAEVMALRSMAYLSVARAAAGPPGVEGSITRLFFAELQQRVRRLAIEMLGAEALALEGRAGAWTGRYLNQFRYTIAAGTSEIQKNIIAQRFLGLPKGPQ